MKDIFLVIISCLLSCIGYAQNINPDYNKQLTRRKELEKQGWNYSAKINSESKRIIKGKELNFVQQLFDSTNNRRGDLYVELLNDSIFRTFFIIDDNSIKYYGGNGIMTNIVDTETFATEFYYGFKFIVRCKYYFSIEIADKNGHGASDTKTIAYLRDENRFGSPYEP